MKLAFRSRIALTFSVLTAGLLLVLWLGLHVVVQSRGQELMREELVRDARLAAGQLPAPPWPRSLALERQVRALDRVAAARLTLLDPAGNVVADSRDDPATMVSHADRPERLEALLSGVGSAVRASATLGERMLYVALPVPSGASGGASVLRLARPMTQVAAATHGLQQVMVLLLIVTAALVWGLSFLLADSLARPVRTLVRVARRVAEGDLQVRVEGVSGPEFAELAGVLNNALEALARSVEISQHETRYYAAILEQMSDAVVITDGAGRVVFVNPVFTRLFGLPERPPLERSSQEVALSYDLSELLRRAMVQGAVQRGEVRLMRPEPRILAVLVTPLLDEEQQTSGAIALLRDVTDLHRLDEVRREFVANASHELRTPVAATKALAEALQMGALSDPQRGPQFVAQIVEAADRQAGILDDMLTLTKVESGREFLTPQPLSAAEAGEDAVRQLRPAAERRGVQLNVSLAAADTVTADPGGLRTVLVNLLDNAVKYTPPGGSVGLSGHAVAGGYQYAVSDTGVGIPAAHLPRIFERFYRVDKARDRATGGTGLGLSIVKHLMEAQGGRVTVDSTEGVGSTFTVSFPEAPPPGPPPTPPPVNTTLTRQ